MKGTSKVIMGATLVMVVSLVVILGLILVLLAELYCSFLLHRRQMRNSNPQTTTTATTTTTIANAFSPSHSPTLHPPHQQQQHSPPPPPPPPPPPFTSICSQGVLQAPRSILFPPFSSIHDLHEPKKQHQQLSELHQIIPIQTQDLNANANENSYCIGLVSVPSSLESFMSRAPSKPSQQDSFQGTTTAIDKTCSGGEHLVYISNPIYENEEGKESEPNTPFETPDTSPSRLEINGSSSSDDDDDDEVEVSHCGVQTFPCTPPLTPMKKLHGPEKDSSVSLRDARSLGTSGSDSHSKNVLFSSSDSSMA
ncbi:PREDICTED: pollen-specific leucine-rich repeat extensin-like protein 2 isoform X2 [Lupinus angustifolius]|uniref:pollen-specific leucine-rich repeat extensin-like protein 2 isoform X2 n=1 Tax=Lupinus angustifolius TaxID=3871 RepID=UPI00092EAB6F|nr:PREDICTED: pollen-specific leucine-rich repeat extensin-like protein 2 isoform X2 [Lupinus angustifolius]